MKRPSTIHRGETWVWGSALALTAILAIAATLAAVVLFNGVGVFWPRQLVEFTLADGTTLLGEIVQRNPATRSEAERLQLRVGNRDLYGLDFRWVNTAEIRAQHVPADAVSLERQERGPFLGFYQGLAGRENATWADFVAVWEDVQQQADAAQSELAQITRLNTRLEEIRQRLVRLAYHGTPDDAPEVTRQLAAQQELKTKFRELSHRHAAQLRELRSATALFRDAQGEVKAVAVADIIRFHFPNRMSWGAKGGHYMGKLGELLFGEPREANTEGGLFPAIVGTVLMVFLMSAFSFPLGVVTAVYLREYATDGLVVRLVRIAVNNLAGIPSIVYGIFGLGFFVYGIGGSLDTLFFPERLPTPTFGTGGILWASLTLALLTVPVVIVATEEALGAIPDGLRASSLALGATQFQTLCRLLLPMAAPGILTGFILAMARAAGEVAPLMITGVVKLAPALPLDGTFPYLHLERKFMHLGFHIFDIGFQSPNVEAAKPMVYVTTLVLVLIVVVLSFSAIRLRRRMRRRMALGSF